MKGKDKTSDIKPPKHERITILESQREIWVVGSIDKAFSLTHDEAANLGLALMEAGIYLKGKVDSALKKAVE